MNLLRVVSAGLAAGTILLFLRALYGWYLHISFGGTEFAVGAMAYTLFGLFGLSVVYTVEVYR